MIWATIAHLMVDLHYLPRAASGLLERALAASPVIVLMGARQTGKSTLVRSEPFLGDRPYLTLGRSGDPGGSIPSSSSAALLLHGGRETRWMSDRILAAPWWRVL